jgi:hypothetical protein
MTHLAGRYTGIRKAFDGCATMPYLRADDGRRWSIRWPTGYEEEWLGSVLTVRGPDGRVAFTSQDHVTLNGSLGWYAPGILGVKFNLGAIDPTAALAGRLSPPRAWVQAWASAHGLEFRNEQQYSGPAIGWWFFRITDGTPDETKKAALAQLLEVKLVVRDPIGSFCPIGLPFTAAGVGSARPFGLWYCTQFLHRWADCSGTEWVAAP